MVPNHSYIKLHGIEKKICYEYLWFVPALGHIHETDKHSHVISQEDALNVHAMLAETCTNLRAMLWQVFINMKHATIL